MNGPGGKRDHGKGNAPAMNRGPREWAAPRVLCAPVQPGRGLLLSWASRQGAVPDEQRDHQV
jgi:hypothetical protein